MIMEIVNLLTENDMVAISVICGIGLVCVVYHYIINKCKENPCIDCNRSRYLPTINPQNTIKTTAHRAGV